MREPRHQHREIGHRHDRIDEQCALARDRILLTCPTWDEQQRHDQHERILEHCIQQSRRNDGIHEPSGDAARGEHEIEHGESRRPGRRSASWPWASRATRKNVRLWDGDDRPHGQRAAGEEGERRACEREWQDASRIRGPMKLTR